MNEKERIISLVEQGVLTMDEALELIEASIRQPNTKLDEKEALNQEAIDEEDNQIGEADDLKQRLQLKLKAVRRDLLKNKETLKITQQRLREIEIYAELDELPEDMVTQEAEFKEKERALKAEQEDLIAKETMLKDKLAFNGWDEESDSYESIREHINRAKESTQEFSRNAASEGRQIVQSLTKGVQNLIDNFTTKNVTINVPWIKSGQRPYRKEIDGEGLEAIEIDLLSGDLTITTHDQPHVYLDCELTIYGNQNKMDEMSEEELEDQLPLMIKREGNRLKIEAESIKIGLDGTIYLPQHAYDRINIDLVEGELTLSQLTAQKIKVDHTAGNMTASQLNVEKFKIDSVSGAIHLSENDIESLSIDNVNGEIKIKDGVQNIDIDSINSDITVTKTDQKPGYMQLHTLNGIVRASIPYEVNLEVKAKVLAGKVFHRLKDIGQPLSTKSFKASLYHDVENTPLVKMDVDVTNGKIMLKHNNVVE